jgi:sulfate adenylyltransferase
MVDGQQAVLIKQKLKNLCCWDLSHRQVCDVELLLNGGFNPLQGFLSEADYDAVLDTMRLTDGSVWPMPITLDVSEDFAQQVSVGDEVALHDPEGVTLAVMQVSDKWRPDKVREAQQVYGKDDRTHPAVKYLHEIAGTVYLGGKLQGLRLPTYYDFNHLRLTPAQTKQYFAKMGWRKVVAFQTRNPMHRAHQELTFRAARENGANLLIHPVVGMTKPGDIDHFTRVRCYEKILAEYPQQTTALSLLPLAMRMAGPREALWHALIRRNYGCTHFIVGRDHAGPGNDSEGKPFYGPYDAQDLVTQFQDEIGIQMVPFKAMAYVENKAQYLPANELEESDKVLNISGTELRRRLRDGLEIPDWFSYAGVIDELRRTHPPKHQRGFTVFFTGLSGAGKSTLANTLITKLMETGDRPVTLLDGDIVRKNLSSELGFSKEHRDINIRRIGFVASEITRHHGIAICAPIAPYAKVRNEVRQMVETGGGFIEVHVATPLEICEQRDRKGLYQKARQGIIKGFTGIDDPYEAPEGPEVIIDTTDISVLEAVQQILLKLESLGYIKGYSA